LYAIAWSYNVDYRLLAKYNQLSYPYHIHPGQILRLDPKKPLLKGLPLNNSIKNIYATRKQMAAVRVKEPSYHAVSGWSWPANGTLIAGFNPALGNKGINLAGKPGTPIRATAAGEVVYCGNGLQAYGQMIIIKHNADYFSAYAHNKKLLVKEGERVKSRQIIAQMGSSGADRTMLHFEIRRSGKPVNPLALLPRY
jgi:lipoprotein NlpD